MSESTSNEAPENRELVVQSLIGHAIHYLTLYQVKNQQEDNEDINIAITILNEARNTMVPPTIEKE